MRKTIIPIFLILLITGCKSYVQVYETKTANNKENDEFFVFENDSLKITYGFWAHKGLMSFTIFNKLAKPLYVDWKKSSYIDNTIKLDYWVDKEISKSIEFYSGYYYNGPLTAPGLAVNAGSNVKVSTSTNLERITFIPPRSNHSRSQFYILPRSFIKLDRDTKFNEVPRNDKPKKNTKVYAKSYGLLESPRIFRNFLTFSYTEDFKEEFYIDNEFYIGKIREMDIRHFEYPKYDNKWYGKVKDKNGHIEMVRPLKKGNSFYIRLPKGKSVEERN